MPKISDIEETPNPNAVKFILREASQQRGRQVIWLGCAGSRRSAGEVAF